MNEFEIIAEPRTGKGSAEARRLRRLGRVPAVVYGGKDEPQSVSLHANDLSKQLHKEAFYSHILTLKIDGKRTQVVLKDMQRHPVGQHVTHVDLLRVSKGQALTMNVPVHFTGEDDAPGRKAGGLFTHHMTELEISCVPADLPESIDVDVGTMEIGDTIQLRDIVLPTGVTLVTHSEDLLDSPVVSVHHAQKLDVEPTEEGEEAAEGEDEGESPRDGD